MSTTLVTGATGRLGALTAVHLLSQPSAQLRLLARDPSRLDPALAARCDVVKADLAHPESLPAAVHGIAAALIVTPAAPSLPQLEGHLIDALASVGTPFVVKISGLATAPDSAVDSGRWHAQSEAHLRESGLPHVCLRPLFLMQNLAMQLPQVLESGTLTSAAGDARIAMVHADDVAATGAALLAGATAPQTALTLTGPAAVSYAELADIISEVFGQAVRYRPIEAAQLDAMLAKRGESDWHRQLLLQFNQAFRDGLAGQTSPTVQTVLGRLPISVETFLRDWRDRNVA